jgi:hypothetical protein
MPNEAKELQVNMNNFFLFTLKSKTLERKFNPLPNQRGDRERKQHQNTLLPLDISMASKHMYSTLALIFNILSRMVSIFFK